MKLGTRLMLLFSGILILILIIVVKIAFPSHGANGWRVVDQLAPEDIGISKYVIEGAPPVGKVFVLRKTVSTNGKVTTISEIISYSAGGKTKQCILFFQPWYFPYSTPEMCAKGAQIKTSVEGFGTDNWQMPKGNDTYVVKFGDNKLEFNFEKPNGDRIHLEFTAFTEDYDVAKKRIPALSPMPSNPPKSGEVFNWTYSAILPIGK